MTELRTNSDPGPGGGRRDHRDDGCWFTALAGGLLFLALALVALEASYAAQVRSIQAHGGHPPE